MIPEVGSVKMETDEWGQDPNVRAMRSVFGGMEAALEQILQALAISPYDRRIRQWLETALPKFEKAWYLARQAGVSMNEKGAPIVYAHCLAKVMTDNGIQIPDGILPAQMQVSALIDEVF